MCCLSCGSCMFQAHHAKMDGFDPRHRATCCCCCCCCCCCYCCCSYTRRHLNSFAVALPVALSTVHIPQRNMLGLYSLYWAGIFLILCFYSHEHLGHFACISCKQEVAQGLPGSVSTYDTSWPHAYATVVQHNIYNLLLSGNLIKIITLPYTVWYCLPCAPL